MLHLLRIALAILCLAAPSVFASRPNLLIITTDDMSCDSVGVFGCKLKDTTPHMDQLASRSLRFNHAHTVVGNCMPSRNVMWSGRYPHNNGIQGFRALGKAEVKYPVLGDLMKAAGWYTAIRHKVDHSTPYSPFPWDMVLRGGSGAGKAKRDDVKNPASWGQSATEGIQAAKAAGKPFCILLNIADPHKPFYAEGNRGETVPDDNEPSKVFSPEEVPVPGFLPDDPVVRKELAHYYSSVRRADDAVGAILEALRASGEEENTIILFLSDHGMPLPFAKTQLYHHSTRTPLMIHWPGVTQAGTVDDEHLVSTVDLLPTLLDMVGLEKPAGFDGRSFAALLRGEKQDGWDMVFKSHHENAGGQATPMRAVQTKDWLYIFSPWSNGTRVMSGATAGTSTCRQMRVLARTQADVAARIDLFDHRVPEEAYEVRYDPNALTNLIGKPENAERVATLEKALEDWMVRTKDPLLEVFRKREDAAFRESFIQQAEESAAPRKRRKAENKAKAKGSNQGPSSTPAKRGAEIVRLHPPQTVTAGQKATLKVAYSLPSELGERSLQVTLKDGNNERIERKSFKVSGTGEMEVTFDIPATTPDGKVIFAALVGESIKDALHHVQTRPVEAK